MEMFSAQPGVKRGWYQPYTITFRNQIFFLTIDESSNTFSWNMMMDDLDLKQEIEKRLISYLTNG